MKKRKRKTGPGEKTRVKRIKNEKKKTVFDKSVADELELSGNGGAYEEKPNRDTEG